VTHLRQAMVDELHRRNYSATTIEYYVRTLARFARYFRRPPDRLTQEHIRVYQTYLLRERKLHPHSVRRETAALRFFFVKTLRRRYLLDDTPYPKVPRRLPTVLTVDEVQRLIAAARTLTERAMLMVLYSTGMRNAELRHLQVRDIDSRAMLIHVRHGKGGRDRYVPLSPTLLATLREHWRWMQPKTWLFPGTLHNWRADRPITPKVVWDACRAAAAGASLTKRVSAHTLRHSYATHLLEAGADIRTIQLLLGHAQVRHTVIYLHLSLRHLQAVTNPLDVLTIPGLDTVRRSRRLHKQ
jgi:integrase/recombinase XerD